VGVWRERPIWGASRAGNRLGRGRRDSPPTRCTRHYGRGTPYRNRERLSANRRRDGLEVKIRQTREAEQTGTRVPNRGLLPTLLNSAAFCCTDRLLPLAGGHGQQVGPPDARSADAGQGTRFSFFFSLLVVIDVDVRDERTRGIGRGDGRPANWHQGQGNGIRTRNGPVAARGHEASRTGLLGGRNHHVRPRIGPRTLVTPLRGSDGRDRKAAGIITVAGTGGCWGRNWEERVEDVVRKGKVMGASCRKIRTLWARLNALPRRRLARDPSPGSRLGRRPHLPLLMT
jgi:hypothetical protein